MPYNYVPASNYGGLPPGAVSPVFGYSTPQSQGIDWKALLPYLGAGAAGLGGLGLGVAAGQRNPPPLTYGAGGYLPGTADLQRGLTDVGALIRQLQSQSPAPGTMRQVETSAQRQNTLQGLAGPAAATNVSAAANNFLAGFERDRLMQLQALLGLQNSMASGVQAGEERRRTTMAANRQAQAQAAQDQRAAFFRLLGTLVGGAAGSFIPGVGTAVGAGLGGGLGGLAEGGLNALGIWNSAATIDDAIARGY